MRVYRFEEPIADSLGPRRPRRRRRGLWVGLGAVLVLALAAGGVAWLGRDTGDAIPLGTSIDGVDVGGLTAEQATSRVAAHAHRQLAGGLVLLAGTNRFEVPPSTLGLHADVAAAVGAAEAESTFVERVRQRLGIVQSRDLPMTFSYRRGALLQATLPVRQALNVEPRSATIHADGRGFAVDRAANGRRVDLTALGVMLRDYGAAGPEIAVPTRVVRPSTTTREATAAAEQATSFVGTTHIVALDDDPRRIPRSIAMRAVRFEPGEGGVLRFDLARGVLRTYFGTVYGGREVAPRDARFTASKSGAARIIASRDGRGVDVDALVRAWLADPTARIVPITIGVRRPALTTEEARHMGVTRVVGEFFTPYAGGPRVINIQRAAQILDQYIIPARAEFSLNKALGERTTARGFVQAPMIGDGGILTQSVGGGVSQVATTTFNAAFFAGLKLIAHTPHSFWISRYPKGREATVSWGGPELIFRNNWDAPVVILTHTDDAGITVRMLSAPLGRKVVAIEGEPYSYSKAKIVKVVDKSLKPGERKIQQMPGEDGFHIKYGRKVYRDGKLISRQLWHWRYSPEDGVILIGPKPGAGGGGGSDGDVPAATTDAATTTG